MEKPIPLKTTLEVARQRPGCRLAASVLQTIKDQIAPGVTSYELNELCENLIRKGNANPALIGYEGYGYASCISVNHVAAHGIPDNRPLEVGDVLSVDLALELDGWHGDCAWTYAVGTPSPEKRRLLRAAWQATCRGAQMAVAGGRFGDIGSAIERTAARYGCSVLDSLVGHGIGQSLHEDPSVLHRGTSGAGAPIVPGMVFTIEPVLILGEAKTITLDDGWGLITDDFSLCAQYELTIAVFSTKTEVLTLPEGLTMDMLSLDFPPFI